MFSTLKVLTRQYLLKEKTFYKLCSELFKCTRRPVQIMNLDQLVSVNQSIKIVPSFEESLRSYGLNVNLEENTKQWLEQLKITWKTWKKSPAIVNHIELFFSSVPDPFRLGLVFAVKCEEFKDCKPKTLPYFIIESLQKWSLTNAVCPVDSLKLPAFQVAIQQRNQNFLTLVVKTYQISTIKATVLPLVRDMIKNDSNKQVTQIVIAMELFDDILVEDILFPLILQDKTSMVDEYLTECPSQVKPLLLFLDKLLDKSISIREFVQKYIEEHNVGHIKYDKIHHKPLGKLVARLCNKFNIPIETCKNLSKNRTTGGLRYLIHQKYQEHNVSSSVWEDLVKDSLKNNAGSGQEFIDMLLDYDRKEALKWAEYLKIPEGELPLALKGVSLQDNNGEENWDREISNSHTYYKTSISNDQIVIINSGEDFYDMMVSDLARCNIVSLDCEWKPSFGATQSQVALIQIATADKVYLIDTLALNKPEYTSFWYKFNKSLLENGEIIKLGFGLEQDLKEMKASVGGLSNIKVKGEGLLDLSILWRNLIDTGLSLSSNSDNGGNSLSSLVQSCFGSPLEKSEQCSNWELRPLRDTQIHYAALDAFVLLEIYYFLQKMCSEQGINFEEICNDVMLEGKKKSGKKVKPLEIQQVQSTDKNQCKKVKLLVEPPLSHLMAYLRFCGIDTTVMPITMLWHDAVNSAISEERYVVLSKLKHTPTVNFPQSSIVNVGKGSIKDHLQQIIGTFNIKIQQSDLLTRCINCNEKDLKDLEPTEVENICRDYLSTSNTSITPNQRYTDDFDDYDDYSNFLSDSECDEYHCKPINITSRNKNCKTIKGVDIDIQNADKLSQSQKSAVLCESCGKLFWDEDEALKCVVDMIFNITKLRI